MKRYDRQIALPEIGFSGQQKLTDAKVLVIGAGGLGCPVLQNLAAAGVRHIGIVDGDLVEESNLHRQYLYTVNDCGKNKAIVASMAASKQNPEVKIVPYPEYFTKSNAAKIIANYEIIVDCTDDLASRYLINDVAVAKGIPMVYASIHKFEGQLSVFNYKNGPTYRCLFPEKEELQTIPSCHEVGVLGVISNILGVMQANVVLKIILEIGTVLSGKLQLYNGLDNSIQTVDFQKNEVEFKKGLDNGLAILNRESNPEIGVLSADDFFTEIQNNQNLIIDIRESYEEPKVTFENCQNIPLAQLDDFLTAIDKNQKIVLFCQNGTRSKLASDYMFKKGFTNVLHLDKGIESLEQIKS